jgi:hypothetical protein
MSKYLFVKGLFLALFLYGCTVYKNSETENGIIDAHTSYLSLDWNGTYSGIIPWKDFDKLEVTLAIDRESKYVLLLNNLEENSYRKEYEGSFFWNSNGNSITLHSKGKHPMHFFVGENFLLIMDSPDNKVDLKFKDTYKLVKTN